MFVARVLNPYIVCIVKLGVSARMRLLSRNVEPSFHYRHRADLKDPCVQLKSCLHI